MPILITKKRVLLSIFVTIAISCAAVSIFSLIPSLVKYSKSKLLNTTYPAEHRVLYINSYDLVEQSSFKILGGLSSVFRMNKIAMDVEFLDAKKFRYEDVEQQFFDSLKAKKNVSKRAYDAIIVSDDPALNFVIRFQDELFKDLPVIFFGINNPEKARRSSNLDNVTGFFQNNNFDEMISMAAKLNSKIKNVYAIYDDSLTSYGDKIQFREIQYKFPHYNFYEINSSRYSVDELKELLKPLTEDDVLLMMNSCEDKDGQLSSPTLQEYFVVSNANTPVYRYKNSGMGNGIAGGKVHSYELMAENAAKLLVEVFKGKNINSIPLSENKTAQFVFDREVLKHFNLNKRYLPKNTKIVSRKISILSNYKETIIPIATLIVSLGFLSIIFIFLSLNEHKNLRKLRRSQTSLVYLAEHDFLTDLPNRQMVNSIFEKVKASGNEFAIMLIDIDDFKNINDFYTHLCGDEVLKAVASRLKSFTVDGRFFVCRFGGDEFIVIYTNGHLDGESIELQQMLSGFSAPVFFEDKNIFIQVSVGIVNSADKYNELYEYIADADIAMYQSKRNGKNQVTIFDEELKEKIKTSHEISEVLEDAIENDGFNVLYQPQIDTITGDISGYEALVRLKNVPISPAQFIPVAEENGLVAKIARIVTEKVVQQIAEWRKHGIELHKVSINYSYGQIKDKGYVDFLKGLLKIYNVSPMLIGIEITESLFIDNRESSMDLFNEFNEIGVSLSLDDFGTGYSSLSYLTYIPVETVKIDKSLVDNYLNENRGDFIKNIVRLVHSLNMKLTVEGVEYDWQYRILKEYHCDYIQGYIFSRPISGLDVEKFSVATLD